MEQLGIEPKLILAQIVNFTIIVFILSKLLYKPILTMLEKRKKEIEEGVDLTEKMRAEAEKTEAKKEKILTDARAEGRALIEESKTAGKEEEKAILSAAHAESTAIISKAREEAEALHAELGVRIRHEAMMLASEMTKRLLADSLTGDQQHKILEKHISEIEDTKKK